MKSSSVAEKATLLRDVNGGVRKKDIAEKFGIAVSTVPNIIRIKNPKSHLKCQKHVVVNTKRSKTRKYNDVDETVLKWME